MAFRLERFIGQFDCYAIFMDDFESPIYIEQNEERGNQGFERAGFLGY